MKKCRLRIDTLIDAHCWIRRMDEKGRFELDEVPKENKRSILSADGQKGKDRGDFTKDCSENGMTTFEKVAESNRIEGIYREPTAEELVEHDRVIELEDLTIRDLEQFVAVYQRNARLRVHPGMDVRVGSHMPPKGGEHIREMLEALLDDINGERIDPWNAHIQYESIHPFTDGNGRSGRVIYHWQMRNTRMADLGFLHAFYYQTLRNYRVPRKIPRGPSARIRGHAEGDERSVVGCPEEAVMKYVVYKDPWHGPGKYEVRTEPGERTMAHCSSREEAKRIAHALNTKPAWVSPEELVERAQAQAQPTVVTDPEILSGMPVFAGSRVPIDVVLACVDAGNDMARIRRAYPLVVTDEHIKAARAYKASHPTPEFWQEASAIAVEYEGVGDLIRMYADAGDDAERLSIVIDIGELMADITRAHP
jgi:uncharacterized protein (DUF433 family)